MNRRILLAGGGGYIGSVLAQELVRLGYAVTIADLFWFGKHDFPSGSEIIETDISDFSEKTLSRFEQVIFLAGLSNDPMAEYDPHINFIYNTTVPTNLAGKAKQAGVRRFIFASSCSVYGSHGFQYADEQSKPRSETAYGISKLQAECGILQLGDATFSTLILRQGTVSGHSPRMRMDLLVNAMFMAVMTRGRIRVNNPAIWRPVLHIKDASEAFVRAIQSDYSINGIFNIASFNMTVGETAQHVRQKMQRLLGTQITIENDSLADSRDYRVRIDRAREYLGFQPRFTISDIIEDLFSHRSEYKNYGEDVYYNIKVFQKIFPKISCMQEVSVQR